MGEMIPLFCGSAKLSYGMQALLTKMVELFPHPGEMPGETGYPAGSGSGSHPGG